jgi:hypothetical protein
VVGLGIFDAWRVEGWQAAGARRGDRVVRSVWCGDAFAAVASRRVPLGDGVEHLVLSGTPESLV